MVVVFTVQGGHRYAGATRDVVNYSNYLSKATMGEQSIRWAFLKLSSIPFFETLALRNPEHPVQGKC